MLYLPRVAHQRRSSPALRWTTALAAAGVGLATLAAPARAHEIPQRVAVLGYVRTEGARVELLLRVPLEAIRDAEFPLNPDGSLDVVRFHPELAGFARLWIAEYLSLDADGEPLASPDVMEARLALPNDRSFESLGAARSHFQAPLLANGTGLRWQAAYLDVRLGQALPREGARLVLHPRLAHLGVRTTSALHVIGADGEDRVLVYEGNPDRIALDPRWGDAARLFLGEGFRHILGGIDHLLFVLCLVFPVRKWRSLVAIVTAFTLAHSLTLGASALGLAPSAGWFPPLVETLIAASIVWLAIENILLPPERLANRWAVAFCFGLVHGFGFSFALADRLQFAGGHLLTALAGFNLGVEAGQLLVLAAALPLLAWLHRKVGAERERLVTITGSAIVAHTAWHWMTARGATLLEHRASFAWPALDAVFALGALRVALLATLALALGLALRHILRALSPS